MFVIRQKTRQQESDLTGDGDAGAFRQQGHSHGPVTVVGDEGAQRLNDGVVHEELVLSSQLSVFSVSFSNPAFSENLGTANS